VRITDGAVRPAKHRAVRLRCQAQLTRVVLQTPFQRELFLVSPVGNEKGARHPHLQGIEAAAARFDCVLELANILWGGYCPRSKL